MSAGRKDPCTDIKWDIRISNLDSSPDLIEKDAECSCLKFRIQTCQIWCVESVNMTFRSFFEIMRPHDISRLQFGRKETPVSRHQNAKKLCVASSASVKSRWVWWLCAPEWTFLRSRWYPTVLKPDTQTKNLVIASKERQRFFYELVLALCFFVVVWDAHRVSLSVRVFPTCKCEVLGSLSRGPGAWWAPKKEERKTSWYWTDICKSVQFFFSLTR